MPMVCRSHTDPTCVRHDVHAVRRCVMLWRNARITLIMGSLAAGPMLGCENLPGNDKEQGAVLGGLGGAIAGAAVAGDDDRGVGALIGAAIGAGGGYLIGAQRDKENDEKS